MEADKLPLLKSLRLLAGIPDGALGALSKVLRDSSLSNEQVLFEEGSKGTSLYFVAGGRVLISKRVAGGQYKDLAILGPGDCLGEMALIDEAPRSARASAYGDVQLFELRRNDLDAWLKVNPNLAVGFFAHLLKIQTHRLRRTSDELTLMYDLSSVLLEPVADNKEMLGKVLKCVLPHLEGHWNAAAFLYNQFNDETELLDHIGEFDFTQIPIQKEQKAGWIETSTFYAPFPGVKHIQGYLLFRAYETFPEEERAETGRTLTAVARLVRSAVENIEHRTEEMLRGRLKEKSHGPRL